ncbi:unnamed protein product, partial [Laminaria digitata]
FFATALFVSSTPISADAAERHHHAHEHGVSEAKLALEGDKVEIELRSPGADIVGFEHPAATDADKAAIAKAAGILAKGSEIFAPAPAAGCSLIDADIDAPGMKTDHHDHDHDAKEHAKKDHEHAEAHKHADDGHSEFKAHYRFSCRNTDKLTHIDVKLFQHFPGAQELRVQAITQTGQFVRELKPGSARLAF